MRVEEIPNDYYGSIYSTVEISGTDPLGLSVSTAEASVTKFKVELNVDQAKVLRDKLIEILEIIGG